MQALLSPRPGPQVWFWIAGGLLFAVAVLALLHRLPSRSWVRTWRPGTSSSIEAMRT